MLSFMHCAGFSHVLFEVAKCVFHEQQAAVIHVPFYSIDTETPLTTTYEGADDSWVKIKLRLKLQILDSYH